jgi:hypothetical protein
MIVLQERNVILLHLVVVEKNACHSVEAILAPKVHLVQPKTTKKYVLAILHLLGMAMQHAMNQKYRLSQNVGLTKIVLLNMLVLMNVVKTLVA